MNSKFIISCILLVTALFAFGTDASAQLIQGPVSGINGFPRFIQSPGIGPTTPPIKTQLCLDPVLCSADPPIAGSPFSQKIGFGREVFYFRATADIGQLATVEMGVKTWWLGGIFGNGRQRVLNFIRVDLRNLPAGGTYRVDHPYGSEVFNVVADPQGQFNVDFIRALAGPSASSGPVTKFLRAAPPPAGFLGDSSTPVRVIGSPVNRNFVRIVGPAGVNLGGTVQANIVSTNLFQVEGQLAR